MTAPAKKQDEPVSAVPREVKPIPVKNFAIELTGLNAKWAYVNLPEGTVLQDLHDNPDMWKLIQGNANTALNPRDRVTCFDYEGRWAAEAMVGRVEFGKVYLTKPSKVDLPDLEAGIEDATTDQAIAVARVLGEIGT